MNKTLINKVIEAAENAAPSFVSQGCDLANEAVDNVGEFFDQHGDEIVDGALEFVKGIFGGS